VSGLWLSLRLASPATTRNSPRFAAAPRRRAGPSRCSRTGRTGWRRRGLRRS